jgi:hypothetical protein
LSDSKVGSRTTIHEPANVIPVLVAVITQIAAVVVVRFRLSLGILLPFPSSFLLPATRMQSPRSHVRMALAGHHAAIVLAILETKALQIVTLWFRISLC